MFESRDHFKYILLVIDVFSTHVYTECLKNKQAKTVGQALEKIFSKFETPISKFETDQVKVNTNHKVTTILLLLKYVNINLK